MGNKIIFGLIGFLLGGMGGFFVGGTVCAREYKKTIESLRHENEALKEESRRASEKSLSEREKAVKKAEVKYRIDDIIKKEGYSAESSDDTKKDEKTDESEDDPAFDVDEDLDFDDPFDGADPAPKKDADESAFKVLTEEEYEEHSKFAEKSESLTYYQKDGVLADAFDEPLKNGVNLLGAEAMLAAQKTGDKFIYVWDNDEEILYDVEINRVEHYSEAH